MQAFIAKIPPQKSNFQVDKKIARIYSHAPGAIGVMRFSRRIRLKLKKKMEQKR
jgi:hypothetical protein